MDQINDWSYRVVVLAWVIYGAASTNTSTINSPSVLLLLEGRMYHSAIINCNPRLQSAPRVLPQVQATASKRRRQAKPWSKPHKSTSMSQAQQLPVNHVAMLNHEVSQQSRRQWVKYILNLIAL